MADDENIKKSIFIKPNDSYNNYGKVEEENTNKALKFDNNGNVEYKTNNFNKASISLINNKNILQFRNEEKRSFLKRTSTELGDVTEQGKFLYNGGNVKNEPKETNDKEDSTVRKENIYKNGKLNVNVLRNIDNLEQNV